MGSFNDSIMAIERSGVRYIPISRYPSSDILVLRPQTPFLGRVTDSLTWLTPRGTDFVHFSATTVLDVLVLTSQKIKTVDDF